MKNELVLFIGIFLFLTIGIHFEQWTSHPIEHLMALANADVYGVGVIHPLVFTLIVYIIIWIPRIIVKFVNKSRQ